MPSPKPPNQRIPAIVVAGVAAVVVALLLADVVSVPAPSPSRITTPGPDGSGTHGPLEPVSAPPDARLFPEVLSVTDATEHDGIWFVLDARAHQIHLVSPEEGVLESFGREGEGPGEFGRPTAIVAHGDSIVVVAGGMLHLFSVRGEHIVDRRLGPGLDDGCILLPGSIEAAVSLRAGILLLVKCFDVGTGSVTAHAAIETGDGRLRSIARRDGEPGEISLSAMSPILAVHPDGFLFGHGSDSCLSLIDPSGLELDTICHGWIEPVPLPSQVARELFGNAMDAARQAGVRLRIPDELPAVVGVSVANRDRFVYRVLLPGRVETATMGLVTQDEKGSVLPLDAPHSSHLFMDGLSVMAAWEEMEGTRMAFRTMSDLDGH